MDGAQLLGVLVDSGLGKSVLARSHTVDLGLHLDCLLMLANGLVEPTADLSR